MKYEIPLSSFYFLQQQLAERIKVFGFVEPIFGNEKKGPRIEIKVEEIGGFDKLGNLAPGPGPGASFIANRKSFLLEMHGKMILEGGGPPVYRCGHHEPERDHHEKPEQGAGQEGKGKYFLEIKKHSRTQGKYIHHDDHDSDFRP